MGIFQQINGFYLHDFSSYYNLGFKQIIILCRKEKRERELGVDNFYYLWLNDLNWEIKN